MKLYLAMACFIVAVVATGADDRKDIDALYAKLIKAIETNHPEATLALETPDFTSKDHTGKAITGKQLAEQMKMESAASNNIKMSLKIAACKVTGKMADVSTTFTYQSEMVDKDGHMGPKGKTHVMSMSGKINNKLAKTAAGWKFKSMEEIPGGAMMMDGKPFDPSKMMGGARPKKP